MLIRFSVENFLSFKDRTVFSMISGKSGRDKSNHLIEKQGRNDISILKTAVVFGANASGKSNLVKAIDFGKTLVLRGTPTNQTIKFQNFRLNKDSIDSSSRIEYEIKHKGKNYAYGFVFTNKEIVEEWLFEINSKTETKIFERTNEGIFDLSFLFKKNKGEKEKLFLEFTAKGTPNNQLFLTEIRTRKVKENVTDIEDILNVIDWFQNSLTVMYPNSRAEGIEFELQEDVNIQNIFEELLSYFDTGINGICLEEVDFDKMEVPSKIREKIKEDLLNEKSEKTKAFINNYERTISYIISKEKGKVTVQKMMTKHKVIGTDFNEQFDLNEESDGTRRIMDFIPLLMDLFKGDNVFIVDEMERSLHPNLIYDLIDLFLSKSENISSQLILASHESSLLTQKLLRKDEIWFVVKNELGASDLHSLEDYNIRFDKEIRKDYLLGRYKAVPRLGNRNDLTVLTK